MKKLSAVVLLSLAALLYWRLFTRPDREPPVGQPWSDVLQWHAAEAERLDRKFEALGRLREIICQTEAALIDHELSLQAASERIIAAARDHFPDFLGFLEVEQRLCTVGSTPRVKVAYILVERIQTEMCDGNPKQWPKEALPRLARELREMQVREPALPSPAE